MNPRRAAATILVLAAGLGTLFACSREAQKPEDHAPAFEALLARCRAVVAAHPGDANAIAELALAFEANGRWVEAARHYELAVERDPANPLWVTHAAICETEAGELEAARRALESGASRFPACAPILQRLGVARLEDGEFARAREAFQALAQLEQHAVEGWTGIAEAELAVQEADAALAAAERARSIDPAYRLPRYLRVICLRDLGRESEAAGEFELAGTTRRRMIGDAWSARAAEFTIGFEARFARAVGLLDGRRASEAVAAFEALARERPDDVRTLGNLAMAQAATKNFAGALASCDSALAHEPDSAALHSARARVLLGAGRPADALASARRASELDPRDPSHFEVLCHALLMSGETQALAEALQEALRLDPSNASLRRRVESLDQR